MGTVGNRPSRAVVVVGIGDVDGEIGLFGSGSLEIIILVALGEDDECDRTDALAGDDAVFVDRGDLFRTVATYFTPSVWFAGVSWSANTGRRLCSPRERPMPSLEWAWLRS